VRAALGPGPPSSKTLLQYLGVAEQRATEVLQAYVSLAAGDAGDADARLAAVLAGTRGAVALELSVDAPSAATAPGSGAASRAGSAGAHPRRADPSSAPGDVGKGAGDRPLDLAALAKRAQQAVEGRLESSVRVKASAAAGGGAPPATRRQ